MRWLVLAVVPACTYITQAQYERELAGIDEDGDGAAHSVDCDDEDPLVKPGAVDVPYDGVDADCDGVDLIDVDGDGFPGITESAYAALSSKVPYPEALHGKDLDCDDNDPKVFPDPTKAIEVLYDAIDSDCQRDNDFDFDGDGFIPTLITIEGVERAGDEVFQEYLDRWGITPAEAAAWAPPGHLLPVAGDCDDRDGDVHPENSIPDVPYDGVDRDCDGSNDFDADGDCFMPPQAEPQYAQYVSKYFGDHPVPFCVDEEDKFGDCVDQVDPDLQAVMQAAGLQPADIHPSTAAFPNVDAPYDSVDADCAQDNDFDGDGDGFVRTVSDLDDMNAYATLWGYEALVPTWVSGNPDSGLATPTVGDCDDTRFDTWPGALEVLGDAYDQDCAGDGPDVSAFGFGGAGGPYLWTNPTNPEITRLGDLFLVMVGAENGSVPGFAQEFGISIPFVLGAARGPALPDNRTFQYWKSPFATLTMQGLLDIALDPNPVDQDGDGIPDPTVRTLSNSDSTVIAYTYLNLSGIQYKTGTDQLYSTGGTNGVVPALYAANGMDLVMDGAGNPFGLACAAGRLDAVYSITAPVHDTWTPDGGDACFFSTSPVQLGGVWSAAFELCTAGDCNNWTLSQSMDFANKGTSGHYWVYGDQDEGWISLIDNVGQAWVEEVGGGPQPVLQGKIVTHLDTDETGGNVYVAAIVDDGGTPEVWLAYGDPAGAMTETLLPFDDPHVAGELPQRVGVHADADRVAVAVSASTGVLSGDSVGWVFLAPAP